MSLCAIKDSKSKFLLTKNSNKMHLSLDMNNSLGWTPKVWPVTGWPAAEVNIQQVLESSLIVSVADLNNLLLIIPTSNTSEVRAESIKRMSDEDISVSGSHSGWWEPPVRGTRSRGGRGHRRVQRDSNLKCSGLPPLPLSKELDNAECLVRDDTLSPCLASV